MTDEVTNDRRAINQHLLDRLDTLNLKVDRIEDVLVGDFENPGYGERIRKLETSKKKAWALIWVAVTAAVSSLVSKVTP